MAISQIPPASAGGGSSTPLAAGALVASGTSANGWFSTTLAAGTYQAYIDTPTRQFSIHSYNNNIREAWIDTTFHKPYTFTLTTSDKVTFNGAWSNPGGERYNTNTSSNERIRVDSISTSWTQWPYSYRTTRSEVHKGNFMALFRNNSGGYEGRSIYFNSTEWPTLPRLGRKTAIQNFSSNSESVSFAGYVNNAYFLGRNGRIQRYVSTGDTAVDNTTNVPLSYIFDINYGGGMYVAVSNSTTSGQNLASSTDGITWGLRTSGANHRLFTAEYANGIWVVGGQSGTVYTSTDTYTWTARATGLSVNGLSSIKYNATAGKWLVFGHGSGIYSYSANVATVAISTDTVTWTTVKPSPTAALAAQASEMPAHPYSQQNYDQVRDNAYNLLVVYDGYWYASCQNGGLLRSADGVDWEYGSVSLPDTATGFCIDDNWGMFSFSQDVGQECIFPSKPLPITYQIYSSPLLA